MIAIVVLFAFLWLMCAAEYYLPQNMSRSTLSGIQAYRSSLTLDWLAAEDSRQRELVAAFENESSPPRILTTDCIGYMRPSAGKVARLMLELLKNLEGDDGTLILDLIQVLIRGKLLVETSMLDIEPDLEALVETPGVMMGEPHTTFPRILAMIWMLVSDPATINKYGWCPIKKVNKYLSVAKPVDIAKHMRAIEPIIARARFIMEDFIQNVTPLNIYQKANDKKLQSDSKRNKAARRPTRTHDNVAAPTIVSDAPDILEFASEDLSPLVEDNHLTKSASLSYPTKHFLLSIVLII